MKLPICYASMIGNGLNGKKTTTKIGLPDLIWIIEFIVMTGTLSWLWCILSDYKFSRLSLRNITSRLIFLLIFFPLKMPFEEQHTTLLPIF